MAENQPSTSGAGNNGGNNRKKPNGNNFFRMRNRFHNARDTGPKQRNVSMMIPSSTPHGSDSSSGYSSSSSSPGSNAPSTSFGIKKTGPYSGWQLYFPEVGMFRFNTHTHSYFIS